MAGGVGHDPTASSDVREDSRRRLSVRSPASASTCGRGRGSDKRRLTGGPFITAVDCLIIGAQAGPLARRSSGLGRSGCPGRDEHQVGLSPSESAADATPDPPVACRERWGRPRPGDTGAVTTSTWGVLHQSPPEIASRSRAWCWPPNLSSRCRRFVTGAAKRPIAGAYDLACPGLRGDNQGSRRSERQTGDRRRPGVPADGSAALRRRAEDGPCVTLEPSEGSAGDVRNESEHRTRVAETVDREDVRPRIRPQEADR